MVLLGSSWLAAGRHALPLLPFDPTAPLPLPGEKLHLQEDESMLRVLELSARHYGCVGQRLSAGSGAPTTVVAVLHISDHLCDVTCVGRARAPVLDSAASSSSTPVVPFCDDSLEPYDVMAAADYETQILTLHAECRDLEARLQPRDDSPDQTLPEQQWQQKPTSDWALQSGLPRGWALEPGPLVGTALSQPLDAVISQHRGALEGEGSVETSSADGGETACVLPPHPGSLLSSYATRRASGEAGSDTLGLRSYSGAPPAGSLSGFEFWGTDHDAAETQWRSFATARHLPPLQRLRALQTRDTLERQRASIAALSARQRLLTAQLALQEAAADPEGTGGAGQEAAASSVAARGCGTERGAWGVVEGGDGVRRWAM